MASRTNLKNKYDFSVDVLDVIIGGRSMLDAATGLRFVDDNDIDRFLRSYGYDLADPIENAELHGNFREALNFIRKNFLQPENPDGLKVEIPRKFLELTDLHDLFQFASLKHGSQGNDPNARVMQAWACSLLKVMHTIAHIDKDPRASYFGDVQQQILDRYYKVIHRDANSLLYLGSKDDDLFRVNLVTFETKPKKTRESTILKLLHKPENVAEDIFDRVGIRFVTQSMLDSLRVVKFLKDRRIVMPANIKPSRSRNTLVDVEDFRNRLAPLLERLEKSELNEDAFLHELEPAAHVPGGPSGNPHSSEFYRAIQFTSRQLIKLKNPIYDDLKELKSQARARTMDDETLRIVDRIDLRYVQREVRFFYPYEVQVMDQVSAEENERGRSAHGEYKRSQVQAALKRVMGSLADAVR